MADEWPTKIVVYDPLPGVVAAQTIHVCALCDTPIPDGCEVSATWSDGGLTGVEVTDADGDIRHQCGTEVFDAGQDTQEQMDEGVGQHG